LSLGRLREIEAAHPQARRATYRVPHSLAGTAADYVHHLARLAGAEAPVAAARGELAGASATRQ